MIDRDDELDPLPCAPWSEDVAIYRGLGRCVTNLPRVVVQHSPDGYNFGYAGSGPLDFALNILTLFVLPALANKDHPVTWRDMHYPVSCYHGVSSLFALRHHLEFTRLFVATIKQPGGVIRASTITDWINDQKRRWT
jgi:hypothetical protein